MQLQQRIELLVELGIYMQGNNPNWLEAKQMAYVKNGWFIPEFIDLACNSIAQNFLQKEILTKFSDEYKIQTTTLPKTIGVVMAGNIPLVGFHDFLCVFLSGHKINIKLSEKDEVLLPHLIQYLFSLNKEVEEYIQCNILLKNCDAYIATGGNNTARYFEQYFGKYPNIIRNNKTSIAVLTGNETEVELALLADDIHLFFGLGCRNVTKLLVPKDYDFVPFLNACRKYNYFADHFKYKNNLDYNLAIHLLNKTYYMSNESLLLIENENNFSPISQLNYTFYENDGEIENALANKEEIQCIVGHNHIPFGQAQKPTINQFADGVDTMLFLQKL